MDKIFDIQRTNKFKKNYAKIMRKQNYKKIKAEFEIVVEILSNNELLPKKYNNHLLEPKANGIWECHILPDVLMEYKKNNKELILLLVDIDTHSNLF